MAAEGAGYAARDLLIQEGQAILAALSATGDQNAAIHAARKAIRRMRAVLALLNEDALSLERDDLALRRLGKGLSDLRDAHVTVETAHRLRALQPGPGWAAIVASLVTRRDRILRRELANDSGFRRRRKVVEAVSLHLEAQPWECVRRSGIRAALARSERRVKKAGARAARDGDAEAVHRWRRRVRRLRMQLDAAHELGALHGQAHSGVARKAKALHKISDRLGWRQDLQLLRNLVRAMPADAGKAAVLGQIDAALASTTH
ncbi:CHAD domain-containing protein [Stenotrophomonas sp. PD6]|uniref:CHAD domain-containing protein n=1 Tax=Stenotrophomonas sp. PD6 TaxID=3368612 RepID=UPI003BA1FF2B